MTTIASLTSAARTLDTLLCPHTAVPTTPDATRAVAVALARVWAEVAAAPVACERALACARGLAAAAARHPAAWALVAR